MSSIKGKLLEFNPSKRETPVYSDYDVIPEQMDKLTEAYTLFVELAQLNNGKVEQPILTPRALTAGVTAYFRVLYLDAQYLERVAKVLGSVSALSVDSLEDGTVCISFTVPNVFKHKNE